MSAGAMLFAAGGGAVLALIAALALLAIVIIALWRGPMDL